ncbi:MULTISPECIES: hypothetical protein [Streptomyces]|uniref:Uncharacterized protein n=1 Tax=Streptomyces antimycoticus TaxID=68175 RepID=A0ABD5JLV8_9ACTN|nr:MULTISPECIES: hypothetical protein [Streptomyces]MEE4589438.1 hypothetical protein [Streptomyces sp. DSM 41602]QTI90516.1 hypothetical protein AS97_60460 [Streptomyces sp. AgN23]
MPGKVMHRVLDDLSLELEQAKARATARVAARHAAECAITALAAGRYSL